MDIIKELARLEVEEMKQKRGEAMEQIINGVDVSGCIHYKECKNGNGKCLIYDEKCHRIGYSEEYEDICYYKQLQQLKQDIETRTMCVTCERELGNYKLKTEIEQLTDQLRRKEEECNTYKQALDEIEKIVEKYNIKIQNTIVSKPLEDLFDILQIIQNNKQM